MGCAARFAGLALLPVVCVNDALNYVQQVTQFILNNSSVFTARRVCIVRTTPSQDVYPSVCHTPVLCLNGYKYPQFFLTYR